MAPPSLISVIVPVHDGARFLAEALASVRAQTWTHPIEIVAVDDGSTDGSGDIAGAAGARVVTQSHQGVATARNRGLDEARGDLIAFLDADDVWTPDKLAVQIAFMQGRPEVGYTVTHQIIRLEPGTERPTWAPADVSRPHPSAGTCSLAVWRWAIDRVGRFNPALRTGEDTDWFARAIDAGLPMTIVPEALLVRRVHTGSLSYERRDGGQRMLELLRKSIVRKRGGPPEQGG